MLYPGRSEGMVQLVVGKTMLIDRPAEIPVRSLGSFPVTDTVWIPCTSLATPQTPSVQVILPAPYQAMWGAKFLTSDSSTLPSHRHSFSGRWASGPLVLWRLWTLWADDTSSFIHACLPLQEAAFFHWAATGSAWYSTTSGSTIHIA